jgi:hypothetical protein
MTDREILLRYGIKQAEKTLADAEAMAKGKLSPRSIINRAYCATQLKSVDKSSLVEKIDSLSHEKMDQVVSGLKLVMDIP